MIVVIIEGIAFFLLAAALFLAYQAGEFQHELEEGESKPPVVVFAIIVALAAYVMLVLT